MKEFMIKIKIKADDYAFETFTWRTRCENWQYAVDRASVFAALAERELGKDMGEGVDSIDITEVGEVRA